MDAGSGEYEVLAAGYPFNDLGLRAPDPAGTLIAEFPDARTGGGDLPATLGLPRPDLARIMADRTVAAGAKLRYGASVLSLAQDESGADLTFSDGSAGRYDLVVGADGIKSATRGMLGIDVAPGVGTEALRVVVRHPRELQAVVGNVVPLLARDLARLASDAHRRVGEEAHAWWRVVVARVHRHTSVPVVSVIPAR